MQAVKNLAVTRKLESWTHHEFATEDMVHTESISQSIHTNLPAACPELENLSDKDILRHPTKDEYFAKMAPKAVNDLVLSSFDPGVLNNELLKLQLYPTADEDAPNDPTRAKVKGNIEEGTYAGTQLALTQLYQRIEQSYTTYFDVLAIDPTLPRFISLDAKKEAFNYTPYPEDKGKPAQFPPAIKHIPDADNYSQLQIFSAIGLAETIVLLQKVIPNEDGFFGKTKAWLVEKERAVAFGGNPQTGVSMQDVVDYNKHHRKHGTDIWSGGNIGLLEDWYSDRRFADQQFTGTNPTTICRASAAWVDFFTEAARANGGSDTQWGTLLPKSDPSSLFVQDCSYFRKAFGVSDPEATLSAQPENLDQSWAVASVSLFQLHDDGMLHPAAICIDYKGSAAKSVTIFNKRMSPQDSTANEREDWPWRYAKTCAQVSDWMRHELIVHLTLSHFVEEAIIIATNRTIPMEHVIYRLLSPHWYKTLPLNAAARATLVPQIIDDIVGITSEQVRSFIRDGFDNYDFQQSYVPADLNRRGFPNTEEGLKQPKYRNYAYAKNIVLMWHCIRNYVVAILETYYDKEKADWAIAEDTYVQAWVKEVHEGAQIKTFPEIKTLNSLADAITMCIHIASPFHSAVNYLQNFYQIFVPAKPASLCRAPPTSLEELRFYKEADMVASLPINRQRQWMLSAQVPWLLSYKVDDDRSLLNFAASQWRVYRYKHDDKDKEKRDISEMFYLELQELQKKFYYNSVGMADGSIPYMVLDPGVTAISILI